MNKSFKLIISATSAMVLLSTLAACTVPTPQVHPQPIQETRGIDAAQEHQSDQGQALERYVQEERAQIPAVMAATPSVYSDIRVESLFPCFVIFTYTYAEQKDQSTASSYFDSSAPSIQNLVNTRVVPAMRRAGVKGPSYVSYIYKNADGSTIWKKEFKSP